MKTRCPACGATCSLDALLGHGDASQAFVASLNLTGDLAKPLVKYLAMFRSENRDLTFERTAKLLNELAVTLTRSLSSVIALRILRLKRHGCGQLQSCWNVVTKGNCNYHLKTMAIYTR